MALRDCLKLKLPLSSRNNEDRTPAMTKGEGTGTEHTSATHMSTRIE